MKILVFTQAVDINDPILGFFHGWLKSFSAKFDEITVIALGVGQIALPSNIKIYSLGKEKKHSKLRMLAKLFVLIWKNRHAGEAVFVHMNKEYVLAGWLIWKLFGLPIYFWYNHKKSGPLARVAMKLSKKVFYTSPYSAGAKYINSVAMPVGVDTDLFTIINPIYSRGKAVLSLGRIDPIKKIDLLAAAVKELYKNNQVNFHLTIIGSPSWGSERYAASIRERLISLVDKKVVSFVGSITHDKTASFFNQNLIFVNLTPSGSFDKTILEAMACGCLIISANQSVWSIIGKEGQVSSMDYKQIAKMIMETLNIPRNEVEIRSVKNREFVLKNHSLHLLGDKFLSEIKSM